MVAFSASIIFGSYDGHLDLWIEYLLPSFSHSSSVMNGANGAKVFTDDSAIHHTVSGVGDTQINTSMPKFGTGSARLDGSGDYLSVPDSDSSNSQFRMP